MEVVFFMHVIIVHFVRLRWYMFQDRVLIRCGVGAVWLTGNRIFVVYSCFYVLSGQPNMRIVGFCILQQVVPSLRVILQYSL